MEILFTILLIVLLFWFLYLGHGIFKTREQLELSGEYGVYKGPAGEPSWNGELPEKVNNYTEPRYVYENLVESTDFLPINGRIIGYRISPSLVIHSRVQDKVKPSKLGSYISRLGGKLLLPQDIDLLRRNWGKISYLRQKAGDTPLDVRWFWARLQEIPVIVHYEENISKDILGRLTGGYPLILKR